MRSSIKSPELLSHNVKVPKSKISGVKSSQSKDFNAKTPEPQYSSVKAPELNALMLRRLNHKNLV